MQVQVNGETREVDEHTTLTTLITELALPAQRIAVELNGAVVRRSEWPTTELNEGDRIEVVHFVGGGSIAIRCRVRSKTNARFNNDVIGNYTNIQQRSVFNRQPNIQFSIDHRHREVS